ncbi:MAG: hypothetical protein MJB14_07880 [Spirochaetes bacterium]|nr:hypothetical protein [Spirochaetota bacterium]
MHKFFDNKFNKLIVNLSPGEYHVTEDDIIVQTLLGSCVSVCLYSDYQDLVGMNHFMLPETTDPEKMGQSTSGRYGMFAMEVLINTFIKKGINKNHLKAKVFGGGNVIDRLRHDDGVASNNIKFIINFLEDEKIPMISSHLGGSKARKILFFSRSRKVLLKEISSTEREKTLAAEEKYHDKLESNTKKSNVIFFD